MDLLYMEAQESILSTTTPGQDRGEKKAQRGSEQAWLGDNIHYRYIMQFRSTITETWKARVYFKD